MRRTRLFVLLSVSITTSDLERTRLRGDAYFQRYSSSSGLRLDVQLVDFAFYVLLKIFRLVQAIQTARCELLTWRRGLCCVGYQSSGGNLLRITCFEQTYAWLCVHTILISTPSFILSNIHLHPRGSLQQDHLNGVIVSESQVRIPIQRLLPSCGFAIRCQID